ncbi:hypothetical protein [Evansella cellulosilytica]|uniref:Uncharacterized protein n=1 Tax=Evansella cellulosilytica (strain ATCC 21833 / DSM 2522 / FERM P-1141 / JCM 9156 / N-4) TaxID=649639 RepID=E6TWG9_EVAC2|nr:hypothetical protein [Evansella cellulosilytica]ADU32232.1 hypothetical protein Bcell_4001 [Evansella cellulosilytica DSM 2522]
MQFFIFFVIAMISFQLRHIITKKSNLLIRILKNKSKGTKSFVEIFIFGFLMYIFIVAAALVGVIE